MKSAILAILFPFAAVAAALTPDTIKDDIPGTATIGEIVTAGGSARPADVHRIVDGSFNGGTQEVNRVTGAFDGATNKVALLDAAKRDKDDLRVYRKVKDIWTWKDWPNDWATTNAPADFLEVANSPGTIPLEYHTGAWMYASQFWPNGNLKYDSSMPPGSASSGADTNLNFRFVARAEDGVTELYRFGATASRKSSTDETLVDWFKDYSTNNASVRIATTDLVDYKVMDGIRSATNGLLKTETDPVWNSEKSGYQTKIDDLDDIRAGAELGATALQEHQSLGPATNYTDEAIIAATNGIRSVDGAARPLPKYLHERSFDDSYPDEAKEYYRSRGNGKADGGCSAVRDGGFMFRNFDYPFDERAEFVVKMSAGPNRLASVGIAQVGTNLTEQIGTSGKPSRCYKWLPGATVDGINENGVVAEINVVDGDPQTSGWHTGGDIHPLAAVRWALDNGTSAGMVASNLALRIAFPSGWEQNFHFMVADERETWIVENGTAYQVTNGVPAMTNFRLYGDPKDTTGEGQERYIALTNGANITSQWWTLTYTANGYRASDLPGITGEVLTQLFNYWENNPRESHRGESFGDKVWWQTVHTSVYDISNRVLRVAVQEIDDWYTFQVPATGGGVIDAYTKAETDEIVEDAKQEAEAVAIEEAEKAIGTGKDANFGSVVADDIECEGIGSDNANITELRVTTGGTFTVHPNAEIVIGGSRSWSDYGLDAAASGYLPLSGGTVTGEVTFTKGIRLDSSDPRIWYRDDDTQHDEDVIRYYRYSTGGTSVSALGGDASSGEDSVSIGPGSESYYNSVAIGNDARGYLAHDSVIIGMSAFIGAYGVAIGSHASAGPNTTVIGYNAGADEEGTAVGYKASAQYNGVAVGYEATAEGEGVAVGADATADNGNVAIGPSSYSRGVSSVAVGYSAIADGEMYSTAFGSDACASADNAIAIGHDTLAEHSDSVVIGYTDDGTGWYKSHGTNTLNFGTTDDPDSVYFREKTMTEIIQEKAPPYTPSADDTTFVMEVLKAVGVENSWKTNAAISKIEWCIGDDPGIITVPTPKYGYGEFAAAIQKDGGDPSPWDDTLPTEQGSYVITWVSGETEAYQAISDSVSFTVRPAPVPYYMVGVDPNGMVGQNSWVKSCSSTVGWSLTEGGTVIADHQVSDNGRYIVPDGAVLRSPSNNNGTSGDPYVQQPFGGAELVLRTGGALYLQSVGSGATPEEQKSDTTGANRVIVPNLIGEGGTILHATTGYRKRLEGAIEVRSAGLVIKQNNSGSNQERSLTIASKVTGSGPIILAGDTYDSAAQYLRFTGDMRGFTGTFQIDPETAGHLKNEDFRITGAFGGTITSLPEGFTSVEVNYDGLSGGKGLRVDSTTIPTALKTKLTLFGSTDFTAGNLPLMTFPEGTTVNPTEFTVKHAATVDDAATAFANLAVITNVDGAVTLVANPTADGVRQDRPSMRGLKTTSVGLIRPPTRQAATTSTR